MFDSPMEYCPVCRQMVVLDQARAECVRRQDCSTDTACPLQKYFTGIDGSPERPKEDPSRPR